MMPDVIPSAAIDYIKNKKLKPGFSYKDVWHEEHATAFTVAKAMQTDVLSDLHKAVTAAMEKGQSFESFRKNITPVLREKGWWGRKEMLDPVTGKTVAAQLGSDRRLKTIYNVNTRSAFQRGQYERTMASDLHPYLMYRVGPSKTHREEHLAWDGLVLPKEDPWWDSHFPPNGYGCKCRTIAVTEARKKKYEAEGIPTARRHDGTGGGNIPAKNVPPKDGYHYFYNERKRVLQSVPNGVNPAFNWHQGKAAGGTGPWMALEKAADDYRQARDNPVPVMADRQRTAEMQAGSDPFFEKLEKENFVEFGNMSSYSSGTGPEVNKAIFTTDWENGPYAELIRSLDSTISRYPVLGEETWFFKGDDASHWNAAIMDKTTNSKEFLSTSINKTRAEDYISENKKANPFMVVIRAPKGTKGLYIGSNTAYDKNGEFMKNEYEYLFPRDATFRVLEKGETHIVLEAVVE